MFKVKLLSFLRLRVLGVAFVLLVSQEIFAQVAITPQQYTYNGEKCFVFPFRSKSIETIPPSGFVLPDGKYIMFHDYVFKNDKSAKKVVIADSTTVLAVFSLANNLPNGPVVIFNYNTYDDYDKPVKISKRTEGFYKDGLKDGKWTVLADKQVVVENYKNGLKHGESSQTGGIYEWVHNYENGQLSGLCIEKYKKVISSKKKYRAGELIDTVYSYHINGKLKQVYDLMDKSKEYIKPVINAFDVFYNEQLHYQVQFRGTESRYYVKSFYREYDSKGKLELSFRFNNGYNPEFDSLVLDERTKVVAEKFMVGDKQHYKFTTYTGRGSYLEARIDYYEFNTWYKREFKSWGKNPVKPAKVKIPKVKTEEYVFINHTSFDDFVLKKVKRKDGVHTYHMIPATKYWWEELPNGKHIGKPASINKTEYSVLVKDTLLFKNTNYMLITDLWYPEKGLPRPLYENNRLNTSLFPAFEQSTPIRISIDERGKDPADEVRKWVYRIVGYETTQVFYENGAPANGKFFFSDDKKVLSKNKFDIPALHDSYAASAEIKPYKNGVLNGTRIEFYTPRKKQITGDLEKAFWLKPEADESLYVTEYKNGLPEGNGKIYESEYIETIEWVTDRFKKINKVYPHLSVDANYKEGKLNGPYKQFHYNGKLQMQVNFTMDKYDGRMESFNAKGEPSEFCTWKNGVKEGPYGEFKDGKKFVEANFTNDLLNGDYIEYNYKTGIKSYQLTCNQSYISNKKIFFDNGNIKEEMMFDGGFNFAFSDTWRGASGFLEIREARKKRSDWVSEYGVNCLYKSFYENGKTLAEGRLKNGDPDGIWKFYNVAGNLINEVNFTGLVSNISITGYFNNGKLRCKGLVTSWETGYDCATHQDKTKFEIDYKEAWNFDGTQILSNGKGGGIFQDENGSRIFSGEYSNHQKTGLWKYYDPNGKLNMSGKYKNGKKDGLWFYGDLENLNFEDGACYDENNAYAKKMFEQNQKILKLRTELYKEGYLLEKYDFETDLNKEKTYYDKKNRPRTRRYRAKF